MRILRAYAGGPLGPGELEASLGWAPQSSLRAAANKLRRLGALGPVEAPGGSSSGIALSSAGADLLPVADALEAWLWRAPDGPLPIDDDAARGILRVLTAGWDSTIVRILAEQPLSLGELSTRISDVSYPALKRRLAQLRSTRLVAAAGGPDAVSYEPSDWLRQAVVPLSVAGRWERRHDASAQAVSGTEVEAAFLLALPLVRLPARASGSCTCAALMGRSTAGITLTAEKGVVGSLHPGTTTSPRTWVLGTVDAWLEATIEGRAGSLRMGGAGSRLAASVVRSLGRAFAETLQPIEG